VGEREAVGRLKRGDAGGLEFLVRRHHARGVRAAYLILRDRALAEDVTQGAFVKAYERIGGFDAERPFGPWFARIVINDAVKVAKRRERTSSREVADAEDLLLRLAEPGSGPHEEAERTESRRRVWAALEQLPPTQRAAVVQRYYLGMTEAEMADDARSPAGTVKSRLHAARKGLAKLLRPQFGADGALQERPVPVRASAATNRVTYERSEHDRAR
jgi:RNA polymerase sigma-70 factor (ECF subfamily)